MRWFSLGVLSLAVLFLGCSSDGGSNDDTFTAAATACDTPESEAERLFAERGCPGGAVARQATQVVSFADLQACPDVDNDDTLFAYANLLFAECVPTGPQGPPGAPGIPGTPGTPGTPGNDGENYPNPILFCSSLNNSLWLINVDTGQFEIIPNGCACRDDANGKIACQVVEQ